METFFFPKENIVFFINGPIVESLIMKIVIFQPVLKQYRVPLFNELQHLLSRQGHQLRVVCGSPPPQEQSKGDNILIGEGCCLVENSLWLFNGKLHFLRHSLSHILWADFVITEQANKHFHNYLLIIFHVLGLKKFGYWGHGQNRQGNPDSWRERMKKLLSKKCDWWFAYTEGVARYIGGLGYPKSQITALNNSIDTSYFQQLLADVTANDIEEFKFRFQIDASARIGLFCGSLYGEKRLDFLLDAAVLIHNKNPGFVLLVVGSGDDRSLVEKYSNRYSYIKYLGPLFNKEKALAFKSAEIFLCPGLVGLAILDAFVAGLPLFTCNIPYHSPEIEYLQSGYNGLMTNAVPEEYAGEIVNTLDDLEKLVFLRNNAISGAKFFSIENMAQNFFNGIEMFFEAQVNFKLGVD
ncbi:glycosyltransferase family 4 protein [Methylomonas sp. MK1]|uniref:glycosyltransferase family 4 protein n=1 Tax=Methylomonas sp. MK1 TaxID=1131552 RepID=UPI0003AA9179|nr:glycosyltransferase family 4 protein [Methylomonas sp. MK1]